MDLRSHSEAEGANLTFSGEQPDKADWLDTHVPWGSGLKTWLAPLPLRRRRVWGALHHVE